MTAKTLSLAANTFREARRDRVQWVLLLYAVVVLAGAYILSPISLGEGYRVTRDLGLAALSVVGLVMIVLVGGGLVQKEIDRRTIFTILAKPVRRGEFLLGKYLGLMAMVTAIFAGMLGFLILVVYVNERHVDPAVLVSGLFTLGEFSVLTAVVVAFSSFTSPVLASCFTFGLFVMGSFSQDLLRFADRAPSAVLALAARAFYLVLPHLHVFDRRAEAAYGVLPTTGEVMSAVVYAVLYSAALLAAATAILSRREFK